MPISQKTLIRLAHADVARNMGFPLSVTLLRGEPEEVPIKYLNINSPHTLDGAKNGAAIDGTCSNDIECQGVGLVHVYGDLLATITMHEFGEVIVAGDLGPSAVIIAKQHCNVFVGGRCYGTIRHSTSSTVWIDSDFSGTIYCASPSTELYIGGTFAGEIEMSDPETKPGGMLSMEVRGFASQASLNDVAAQGFLTIKATVGRSDVPAGVYLADIATAWSKKKHLQSHWCVESDG